MSNITQPPPEYRTPPASSYTGAPAYYQQPRPSYRWLWIVLLIFALLCLLGGALVWVFAVSPVGGPTIASDQYYTAIRDQDFAKAYSYLGSDLRANISREDFTRQAQQQDEAFGRVSHYSYSNVPLGNPATATITVTRASGTTYTVYLELRQEGSAWKITAFDRI
jgi:hypothetical protein